MSQQNSGTFIHEIQQHLGAFEASRVKLEARPADSDLAEDTISHGRQAWQTLTRYLNSGNSQNPV